MHGDKSQGQRERAARPLRARDVDTLVATRRRRPRHRRRRVTHVINFDMPGDGDVYTTASPHRPRREPRRRH